MAKSFTIPDYIDIFRLIKSSPSNKHVDIAHTISSYLYQIAQPSDSNINSIIHRYREMLMECATELEATSEVKNGGMVQTIRDFLKEPIRND